MSDSLFSRDLFRKRTRHTVTERDDEPQPLPTVKKRFTVDSTKKPTKWSPVYGQPVESVHDKKVEALLARAHTHKGSRTVQTELVSCSPDFMETLVLTVASNVIQLMTHKYANYLCQTLFQQISCPQRLLLLSYMRNLMVMIAKDTHGTHSLQALVAVVSLPEEEAIIQEELGPHIVDLSKHPAGTHVVQKMLVYLTNKDFILARVVDNCLELATDQTGLSVIKRCLTLDCTLKGSLISTLEANCVLLCQDPFGNYAIQHLLDCVGASPRFYSFFKEKIMALSMQKFASNVVEKALLSANSATARALLSELAHPQRLAALLQSLYGCFVLRSAAKIGYAEFRQALEEQIKLAQEQVTSRKLASRWTSILAALKSIKPLE
mmetsp:Transcript_19891/g.36699  ORF Transcript_19891/g.36699 Transcript_19891/m.36699 type:complete len:379 (+) Transcript_19891:1639-2775(+)